MKKIIFLTLFCITSFCNAQSNNDSLEQIKGVAAYNATFIGYALNCQFSPADIEAVKNQFVTVLNQIPLIDKDYQEVQKSFFETLKVAHEKGPANSNMTCEQFKTEFDKIVNAVKTGSS